MPPFTPCGRACFAPCFAVETIYDRHVETPRSVGYSVPWCSRKFFNENELTHEMHFILLRLRAYVYSWSEYAHLFVWWWTRGYSGYDRSPVYSVSTYPFYWRCAVGQCTWTCGDMQLYDNSGTSKVIALILLFGTYTWHFCKWCRRIAHASNFKPIPRRVKPEQKRLGSTTV